MLKSTINVLIASTSMLHSAASFKFMAARIPSISMDGGMQLEWYQSGGFTDDKTKVMERKHFGGKNVFGEGARECRAASKLRRFHPSRREPDQLCMLGQRGGCPSGAHAVSVASATNARPVPVFESAMCQMARRTR